MNRIYFDLSVEDFDFLQNLLNELLDKTGWVIPETLLLDLERAQDEYLNDQDDSEYPVRYDEEGNPTYYCEQCNDYH